ncbi:MAG: TPR repeat protein [Porticoccus sp.]|jgi:TPR repeat protein
MKFLSLFIGLMFSAFVFATASFASTLEEGYEAIRSGKLEEGLAILSPLAEQGDADAQYGVAILYKEGWGTDKNEQKSFENYEKAAKQGHVNAMFYTASDYQSGTGVIQDYSAAANWYEQASNKGHAAAMYGLGSLYYNGLGVERDDQAANTWITKSADAGFELASEFLKQRFMK